MSGRYPKFRSRVSRLSRQGHRYSVAVWRFDSPDKGGAFVTGTVYIGYRFDADALARQMVRDAKAAYKEG